MTEISSYVVLVLFFSVQLASAQLTCWACDPCPDPHSNTSSQVKSVPCTTSQTVCVKNTVKVLNRPSQISKGCVESCTPSSSNFFGQGAFVDCCNTNLCNDSSRTSVTMFMLLLPLLAWLIFVDHRH